MAYLFLVIATLCYGSESIVSELYNRRVKKVYPFFYSMLVSFVVLVFFCFYGKFNFSFDFNTILYGAIYGTSFCLATITLLLALKIGRVSITSLIFSYSLILPTLFGVVAYGIRPSVMFYVGLGFFVVSLFLLGQKKNVEDETGKGFSVKWLVLVILTFFANAACTISQAHHQTLSDGNFRAEFMIVGNGIVFLFNLVLTLINLKKNKETIALNVKKGWHLAILYGVCNAALNLFVMFVVVLLPTNVIYPIICGGGLLLTLLLSFIIFKEKLSKLQFIGFIVGVVAIVLMNL